MRKFVYFVLLATWLSTAAPHHARAAGRQSPQTAPVYVGPGQHWDNAVVHFRSPQPGIFTSPLATGAQAPYSPCCPDPTTALNWHNGAVDEGGTHAYNVFWQPTAPSSYAGYNSRMNLFFSDINGSSYYKNLTQYFDTNAYISNHSQLVSSWQDSSTPYPGSSLVAANILDEVNHAIAVNGWNPGSYAQVNVILGSGVTLYNGADCGFHTSAVGSANYVLQFTAVAYLNRCNNPTCPNGCSVDAGLNVLSHETFEATSDPFPTCTGTGDGWWDTSIGNQCYNLSEIGDKCYTSFSDMTLDGGLANHYWNGRYYVLQDEWDNNAKTLGTGGYCASYGPTYP